MRFLVILCVGAVSIGAIPNTGAIEDGPRSSVVACQTYTHPKPERASNLVAQQKDFPWIAALGFLERDFSIAFHCAGTVLSVFHVLTAAHCATPSRQPVIVRLGTTHLTNEANDGNTPVSTRVREVVRHPGFNDITKENDIALIRVETPIPFGELIQPACLHIELSDFDKNIKIIAVNWESGYDKLNKGLFKIDMETVALAQCNSSYSEYNKRAQLPALRNGITDSQYCVDRILKNDDCQNRSVSGSPLLVYSNVTSKTEVVGVTSFGIGCGSDLPTVATRVGHYLDWIESVVWPNGVNY